MLRSQAGGPTAWTTGTGAPSTLAIPPPDTASGLCTPTPSTSIGLGYAHGNGVPQDYQEAVKWSRLAAKQGLANALFLLGFMYANSKGVAQDYVQAHKWINLAASRTTGEAQDRRSGRGELAKKMAASQVTEAQRLAREWQPKTWEQLKDE